MGDKGVVDEAIGTGENEHGQGNQEKQGAGDIDYGLGSLAHVVVDEINPYMGLVLQRISDSKENHDREEMPFHFLHADGAVVKDIAHHNIKGDVEGHQQQDKGQKIAHAVNDAGNDIFYFF